jgi:hypothetical protein
LVKNFLRNKTVRLRYSFVFNAAKHLTPSLYKNLLQTYSRGMVSFILKEHKQDSLVGAEVGVYRGTNAYHMLTVLSIKELFLVDPYLPYVDGDGAAWETSENDFLLAKKGLARFNQCQFIRKLSTDAVNDLPDNLDFVYIDANHSYESVKADVESYYLKVRVGGVIGGHDFYFDYQGVIFAVVDFARSVGAKLHVESPDWWIVKEE